MEEAVADTFHSCGGRRFSFALDTVDAYREGERNPEKPGGVAGQAAKVGFSGQEYRGRSPLRWVQGEVPCAG